MRTAVLLAIALLSALPLPGAWLKDLEEARTVAEREEKDIFLVFTSLKTSGACVQFDKRILSQEAFQQALEDDFVLVHLDVPLEQTPGMVAPNAANRGLARQFKVEVYPASRWLDAKGQVYAGVGGAIPGAPEEVAELVRQKQKAETERRDEFREAYQKDGLERARALIVLLKKDAPGADPSRDADHLAELARLDPADTLGFQNRRRTRLAFDQLEESLRAKFEEQSYEGAVKLVDEFLSDHRPEKALHQKVLFRKLAALQKLGQPEEARKTARDVVALDEDSSHGRLAAQILRKLESQ